MYVFAFAPFFFFFFFSSFSLFLGKDFFVATFCMRSILFAGSSREKKSHRFSSLLPLYKRSIVLSSLTREYLTRVCSTCLHKKATDIERQRERNLSFQPIVYLLDINLYHPLNPPMTKRIDYIRARERAILFSQLHRSK
jgi:hypothetical protein